MAKTQIPNKQLKCNDCKAWTEKGTRYYNCAIEGQCPALEKNRSDGEEMIFEALKTKKQNTKGEL